MKEGEGGRVGDESEDMFGYNIEWKSSKINVSDKGGNNIEIRQRMIVIYWRMEIILSQYEKR